MIPTATNSGLVHPPLSGTSNEKLCHNVLTSTYFKFNGQFLEQNKGFAMGSPLSSVVADFLMEDFEKLVIASAPLKPSLYKCNIDDTRTVWPHSLEQLCAFMLHLNFFFDTIQFTMELEAEGQLSFLDFRFIRHADGSIGRAVF